MEEFVEEEAARRTARLNLTARLTSLQGFRVAIDPRAEQRHREWAEREIDEALQILPTPRQPADVLEPTRALQRCQGCRTRTDAMPAAVAA